MHSHPCGPGTLRLVGAATAAAAAAAAAAGSAGSDVRLELVTQGSLFVQETLVPKRRAPRLHLMFQLTGPTKTGVVSVEAKKVFGSKYAFKTLMVELPDKALTSAAAGAAAAAAASKVRAASALENGQQDQQVSDSSSSQSSSSQPGIGGGGPSSSAGAEPARIYIIGGPAGASSSSKARHMSPAVLLEDLKEPMLYALKVSRARVVCCPCSASPEPQKQHAGEWHTQSGALKYLAHSLHSTPVPSEVSYS